MSQAVSPRRFSRTVKPHLFRYSRYVPAVRWACIGDGHISYGATEKSAYDNWAHVARRNSLKEKLA